MLPFEAAVLVGNATKLSMSTNARDKDYCIKKTDLQKLKSEKFLGFEADDLMLSAEEHNH